MRTVGRPSKASALKGQAWAPIRDTELMGLLHEGLSLYFDKWQEDLNRRALAKVEADLKDWFGGNLDSAVERNYLKKLNNSASAPGVAGFDRTLQALNDFSYFKELENAKSKIAFEKFYERFRGINRDLNPEVVALDKNHRCDGCENLMREGEISLHAIKRSGSKQGEIYWHVQCWYADEIRRTVGEFRKLKGGLDKQSKAARAILSMAPNPKSSEGNVASGKMLESQKDYEKWINGIWGTWCESTKVKSDFHKAYFREFHEYADLVLLFRFGGNVSNTSFYEKFIKHVSSNDFQDKYFKGAVVPDEPVTKPVVTLTPLNYADCRKIGEAFRTSNPVIVDTSNASEEDRKRIIDFMAGMTFALHGTIQRVTAGVFLALPDGVEIESSVPNNATDADLLNFFNSPNVREARTSKKIVNQ
jgi:SepF-like predicted cell division protein (DUF552 family)